MSNRELIANLRGENLDCDCAAYSSSECCCSTNWPESFCKESADALKAADKRIAELERCKSCGANGTTAPCAYPSERAKELERKLAIAVEALREYAYPSVESGDSAREALAQIGE